jgi:acyl carrier protein
MTASSRDKIRSLILDILSSVAPEIDPTAIKPERALREQIDIDSFDWLNVIIRLSEVLGFDIPEKDYAQLVTLDSAIEYLSRRSTESR